MIQNQYFLAIDIGASSGRHILGSYKNNKIQIEEIYRFKNEIFKINNNLCWNFEYLFNEIINGLKKCKDLNKIPMSLAIDTWGVDFVLLDKYDNALGNNISYRDHRTDNIPEEVYNLISKEELYKRTGIQNLVFNTIYQLYSIRKNSPELLKNAKYFLMTPDYFNFLLTGKKFNEYTNASTTQLLNLKTSVWDYDILKLLNIPKYIFQTILQPSTSIGYLKHSIKEKIGFDLEVIAAPSHDTASAVLSAPSYDENYFLYLSSGTWSLLGTEIDNYNSSLKSLELNLTNEGGYNRKYRYLKNIMGLWIVQNIKKELNDKYSFKDLCDMASKANNKYIIIDVNDEVFLSPNSMIETIKDYCKTKLNYNIKNINELISIVYNSLAKCYIDTIKDIEILLNKKMESLYIIGGGSKDDYLNSLIARELEMKVYSGPAEATAIGNIISQMLNKNIFSSVKEARKCIFESFDIKEY